tara:strand:- start:14333 stop:14656 length:324 start_codon:yes stop_codon:yes gene_type:complete
MYGERATTSSHPDRLPRSSGIQGQKVCRGGDDLSTFRPSMSAIKPSPPPHSLHRKNMYTLKIWQNETSTPTIRTGLSYALAYALANSGFAKVQVINSFGIIEYEVKS